MKNKTLEELQTKKLLLSRKILTASELETSKKTEYTCAFHKERFVIETDKYFIVELDKFKEFEFNTQSNYNALIEDYLNNASDESIRTFNEYIVCSEYVTTYDEYLKTSIHETRTRIEKMNDVLDTIEMVYSLEECPNVVYRDNNFFVLEKFQDVEKIDLNNKEILKQYKELSDKIFKMIKNSSSTITPFFADFHLGLKDGKLKILNIGKYTAMPFLSRNLVIDHISDNKEDIEIILIDKDNIFDNFNIKSLVFDHFFKINNIKYNVISN